MISDQYTNDLFFYEQINIIIINHNILKVVKALLAKDHF